MQSQPTLNLEELVAPIPGGHPTGADLRADPGSLYYELRDLRHACREDDRAFELDQMSYDSAARRWLELALGCETALREKTKDLEIATWLIEAHARARRNGASEFAGLRDAFKLVNALCIRYGEALHSFEDEWDREAWTAPLGRLSGGLRNTMQEGALIAPIRRIPLTAHRDPPGPFSSWKIMAMEQKGDIAAFYKAIAKTDVHWALIFDIDAASAAVAALDQTLNERLDDRAPDTWVIRDALHDCRKLVMRIDRERWAYTPVA